MKVKYFQDTDTLYIEFRVGQIVEARDLDDLMEAIEALCPVWPPREPTRDSIYKL